MTVTSSSAMHRPRTASGGAGPSGPAAANFTQEPKMTTTTGKRPRPRTGTTTSPRRISAARRAARALELRSTGATFAEIARRLGYSSKTGAHDAVKRGLDATLRKPADTLRKLDLERLDRLFATHYPRACRGDHQATLACLRVMERQAALLGLDAPVRTAGRLEHAAQGGVRIVPSHVAGLTLKSS